MSPADPIRKLIHELSRLPGVGRKSATRLAYFILQDPNDYALKLAEVLQQAKQEVAICSVCGNLSAQQPCRICSDALRDEHTLCVVEHVPDLLAIEASGEFKGQYHVLNGVISPLNGIGPEQLRIGELLQRCEQQPVREVIVATNPTVDGEATALYIRKVLTDRNVRITRLASGIPMGSDIEYLDRVTLSRALLGRVELD